MLKVVILGRLYVIILAYMLSYLLFQVSLYSSYMLSCRLANVMLEYYDMLYDSLG